MVGSVIDRIKKQVIEAVGDAQEVAAMSTELENELKKDMDLNS